MGTLRTSNLRRCIYHSLGHPVCFLLVAVVARADHQLGLDQVRDRAIAGGPLQFEDTLGAGKARLCGCQLHLGREDRA